MLKPRREGRLRVLVVDDMPDAADALCLLLEAWGHEPIAAYDGAAAIRAARAYAPDVVLLDLAMPDMDGLEVARGLRASADSAAVLVMAVSGYGRPQDVRAALAAGCDGHLTKPADPDELRLLLQEYAAAVG